MVWKWLTRWRRNHGSARHVVMYSRTDCHLCDEAWATLAQAAMRYRLDLEKIDVDTDAALAARYGLEVPVVEIDGRVRFRGRVNAVLLERVLSKDADG